MQLTGLLQGAPGGAVTASAAPGADGTMDAAGACVFQNAPLFAPYGVTAIPPEGEIALFLPMEENAACLGVLCGAEGLVPGEVLLQSAGGARVLLKNNGEISLNGLIITREGRLEGTI